MLPQNHSLRFIAGWNIGLAMLRWLTSESSSMSVMDDFPLLQIMQNRSVLFVIIVNSVGKIVNMGRVGMVFYCQPDVCPFVIRFNVLFHNSKS